MKTIIARRDRRYDGRFYFGVKTTTIYCRPICPARPKPENILIFRSPSEAENRGYRPCLRCRPDLAPGTKWLDGTLNTVSRALKLIQGGAETLSVERLAATLGVTDRHLRRLFDQHLGASPVEILLTQKLHFAKQLVTETSLPITEIGFAAGFHSVRRFNEAFQERYRLPPSTVRKARGTATTEGVVLKLAIRLPYDWASVIAYLARHETFGIERVENGTYRRFLPSEDGKSFGSFMISSAGGKDFLRAEFAGVPLASLRSVLSRLRSLFDTEHNPIDLPAVAAGIRVPGAFDPFETAVSIILGQLVSTQGARTSLRKLVERFGTVLGEDAGLPVYAFPSAETLATAPVEEVGLTRSKGAAIRALAQAHHDGIVDFETPAEFASATATLRAIKGIGPWTAAMIAMRCLGDPDAFPANDLVIQRVLAEPGDDPTAWRAARAYLTHCLWRDACAKAK